MIGTDLSSTGVITAINPTTRNTAVMNSILLNQWLQLIFALAFALKLADDGPIRKHYFTLDALALSQSKYPSPISNPFQISTSCLKSRLDSKRGGI